MGVTEKGTKGKTFGRRTFLKLGSASLLFSYLFANVKHAFAYWPPKYKITGPKNYWQGPEDDKDQQYFVQDTVNTNQVDQRYIWARIEGWWQRYQIQEADEKFINWFIKDATLPQEPGQLPRLGGAFMPIYGTYGNRRGRRDSQFHLNLACKGGGIPPNKANIKQINQEMIDRIVQPTQEKIAWLHEIIKDTSLWDYSKIVSTEIYVSPEFETHTFLNLMENPISNISFMNRQGGFEHFELRCICKLLCVNDPNITEDEQDLILFTNLFHIFWTTITSLDQYPIDLITPVHYIVEQFDNYPYTANGIRTVPPFPYVSSSRRSGKVQRLIELRFGQKG